MLIDPFVEWIERILALLKGIGTWVYWLWVLACSFPIGLGLSVGTGHGFPDDVKIVIAVGIAIYVVGIYPIYLWEKSRHKKDKGVHHV